jgi:hypothetical protein
MNFNPGIQGRVSTADIATRILDDFFDEAESSQLRTNPKSSMRNPSYLSMSASVPTMSGRASFSENTQGLPSLNTNDRHVVGKNNNRICI